MSKSQKPLKENEFFPAPGGSSGAINYQTPYGTHTSPEVSQNPAHFAAANKMMGNTSNTAKNAPDPAQMEKDIDQLSKREPLDPDMIKMAIEAELHKMIKPNIGKAKEEVLKNLKKDRKFYSELHFMNIDDKNMKVDVQESKKPKVNIEETKKIFADMMANQGKKFDVNPGIVSIIRDLQEQKKKSDEVIRKLSTP